jgi:hypothetical protein
MMRKILTVAVLAFGLSATIGRQAAAEPIVALTAANQLFSFDSSTPGSISPLISVTGLMAGTSLVGIDFRPATGQLFGVGTNGLSGTIYTLNPLTGAATLVNSFSLLPAGGQLGFGVDFNPVVDALRIVSDLGDNLRATGGGTGVVVTDIPLSASGVAGAAYSNNVAGAVSTTLFDISYTQDALFTQGSPGGAPTSPNTGMLFMVGPLGLNVGSSIGFDISGASGLAFASLIPVGSAGSSLYTINLGTGAATLVGAIGSGNIAVQGLSVQPAQAVPEPGTLALLGIGVAGLIRYARRRSSGE